MTKTRSEPSFKVGDRVTWSSQAAGSWKTKTGVIVQAPEIGRLFASTNMRQTRRATARHRYEVKVERNTTRGVRIDYYYPSTSALTLTTGAP